MVWLNRSPTPVGNEAGNFLVLMISTCVEEGGGGRHPVVLYCINHSILSASRKWLDQMVFTPDPPPPNPHAGGFSFGSNRLMFGNEILVENHMLNVRYI
jgi:hypothetical protein